MATMTLATDRAGRRVHSAALPWLVLALGIPASFFLFTLVQNSVADIARLRFEREAKDANSIIEGRLRSYSDVLYALRALFASDPWAGTILTIKSVEPWTIWLRAAARSA